MTTQDFNVEEYLNNMPEDLKQQYEYIKFRYGVHWKPHYYKQSLQYLRENEKLLNSEIRNELKEKYSYRLEFIELTHKLKLDEITNRGNSGLRGKELTRHIETQRENEAERYKKDLQSFENLIDELVKFKDCPETIHTQNGIGFENEGLNEMTAKNYEVVSIMDITNELTRQPKTKLYKYQKNEK